jgi:hypothetical protein
MKSESTETSSPSPFVDAALRGGLPAMAVPSGPSTASPFDYATLPLADASALRLTADRIRDRMNGIKRDTIAIGRELLSVRDRLPHGAFGAWVRVEFGMTLRTAQNCMNAARLVQSVPEPVRESVSLLPPATLYRLSAPSTPPEVVQEVVLAATEGAVPPPDHILRRLDEAAAERREVALATRKKPGRTEEDAKAIVRRRRADRARDQARLEDEWAREKAQRRVEEEEAREAARRLVAAHPAIMAQVAARLRGPASWAFNDELITSLAVPRAEGGDA